MNITSNNSKPHELYVQLINTPTSITPIPKRLRMKNMSSVAKQKDNRISQKARNLKAEMGHLTVLNQAKNLFANSAHPIFERDYSKDNSVSFVAIHAYLTNSFYLFLECDILCNYQLEYAFHNCPYENILRNSISSFAYGVNPKEVKHQPDFPTFYLNALKAQDKQYITYNF